MISMDKAGIVIAVAIVAAAVGFTATGGSGMSSDIPPAMERTTATLIEASQETSEKLQEIKESGVEVLEKVS